MIFGFFLFYALSLNFCRKSHEMESDREGIEKKISTKIALSKENLDRIVFGVF
jgi:hypothetical protein